MMPLVASNRIGTEESESATLTFYGSSFIAGPHGEIVAEAPRGEPAVITASFDLDEIRALRASWGLFRDRRPDLYDPLLTLDGGRERNGSALESGTGHSHLDPSPSRRRGCSLLRRLRSEERLGGQEWVRTGRTRG